MDDSIKIGAVGGESKSANSIERPVSRDCETSEESESPKELWTPAINKRKSGGKPQPYLGKHSAKIDGRSRNYSAPIVGSVLYNTLTPYPTPYQQRRSSLTSVTSTSRNVWDWDYEQHRLTYWQVKWSQTESGKVKVFTGEYVRAVIDSHTIIEVYAPFSCMQPIDPVTPLTMQPNSTRQERGKRLT